MSISKPIDAICYKLSDGEGPSVHQHLVRVNKEGEILSGMMARLKATHRFAVRTNYQIESGRSQIRVRDFNANINIDVPVRWKASITDDGSGLIRASLKLVKSVHHTIEDAMFQALQRAVDKRGDSELGSWVHNQKQSLTNQIESECTKLGLAIVCVLETDKFVSASQEIKTPSFTVRTQDSDRDIDVKINMRIDPISNQAQSGPKTRGDWEQKIRHWTKDYVERNEVLNNIYLDDKFDKRLEQHIDKQLKTLGWIIQRFTLKTPRMVQEKSLSDNFKVDWTSAKGQKFKFDVKLAIVIEDLGLYDKMEKPELRDFAQDILNSSFEAVLFNKDTDNLSPANFNEIRDALHQMVNTSAKRYGIQLTTLIPDPAIPEWDLLRPHVYNIPAQDYETMDPGCKANFHLVIEGQFSSIGSAFAMTATKERTTAQQVRDLVVERATIFMREIEIADYTNNFSSDAEDSGSVRQRMIGVLKAELRKRFNFLTQDIKVHQYDPDIRRQLETLENDGFRDTHLRLMPDLPPEHIGNDALIPTLVRWRFTTADRENSVNLHYRKLQLTELAETVEHKMKEVLDGLDYEVLMARSAEEKGDLKRLLQTDLNAQLGGYGVAVLIESVEPQENEVQKLDYWLKTGRKLERIRRERELERKRDSKRLELDPKLLTIESDYKTYNALIERRLRQIQDHGEVEYEIEQKIQELEKKLENHRLSYEPDEVQKMHKSSKSKASPLQAEEGGSYDE